MFVPSFSVQGNKNCYKTNSNLHCQLQPLFYNLNLGKKKNQQKTSLRPVDEQLKATHTHIQFFMFQRTCLCPGHHLYKGNPYRTAGCRASIPQPHSPGILAHWQIKDRSQEDKESALFQRGEALSFFLFFQQTIQPEGRGMLIARICFVQSNMLIRLQSYFSNVRSHNSDSSN